MDVKYIVKLLILIGFFNFLIFNCIKSSSTVSAQSCPYCSNPKDSRIRDCNACFTLQSYPSTARLAACYSWVGCYNGQYPYQYRLYQSFLTLEASAEGYSCSYPYILVGGLHNFAVPQNTNVDADTACWYPGDVPSNCQRGEYPRSGECSNPLPGTPTPTPNCPEEWQDSTCHLIPCAFKSVCGCECSNPPCGPPDLCGGGGGPLPTVAPSPTPTPYCTLFCPGQTAPGDGGGLAGFGTSGPGTIEGSGSAPTVAPPIAEDEIRYYGYNSFSCGTFANGAGLTMPCPASSGAGSLGSGGTLTSQWAFSQTYNMLCGETPHTYTASIQSDAGGGIGGDPTETPGPSPTPISSLYPPGCTIGSTPTIAPTGGGGYGDGGGAIGGVSSGSVSCSCSVTLACQRTLELPPSDNAVGVCTPDCDFTVSPDYPLFNTEATFTKGADTTDPNLSINFNDGTSNGDGLSDGPLQHTFLNAGVYDVRLLCPASSLSCTRRVNVYCDNGVVPETVTPTPSPSPTPTLGPWYKLKDSSFTRKSDLVNLIPEVPQSFDGGVLDTVCHVIEQPDYKCLISGEAGVNQSTGTIDTNTAPISFRGWSKADTSMPSDLSPSEYLEYVKERKQYEIITKADLDGFIGDDTFVAGTVYIYDDPDNPDITLTTASFPDQTLPFVLVVDGNVQIESAPLSLETASSALFITGELGVSTAVSELNGIFITTTLDLSYDAPAYPNPLKIMGNLISYTNSNTHIKRMNDPTTKPGIFIQFDIEKYLDLWQFLTIKTSPQQEEIQ